MNIKFGKKKKRENLERSPIGREIKNKKIKRQKNWWCDRWEGRLALSGYTNASRLFQGMASTSVSSYTNAILLFLIFSYKYTPSPLPPFLENSLEIFVENHAKIVKKKKCEENRKKIKERERKSFSNKNLFLRGNVNLFKKKSFEKLFFLIFF